MTPVHARIGRKLIDSLRHASIVESPVPPGAFGIRPMGVADAIAAAIRNADRDYAVTRWSDALSSSGRERVRGNVRFGTRLVDTRTATVAASPDAAFTPIRRIGGNTGWYSANALWKLRGFLDLLAGGVGVRRGRRHPRDLAVGDTVDCGEWRATNRAVGSSYTPKCACPPTPASFAALHVPQRTPNAPVKQRKCPPPGRRNREVPAPGSTYPP